MELSKAILGACRCVTKDPKRPILHGVYLTGTEAIGCDGSLAIRIPLPKQDKDEPVEPMILPGPELAAAVKRSQTKQKLPVVALPGQAKGAWRIFSAGSPITELSEIAGTYPDMERFAPISDIQAEVMVDARTLITLLQAHLDTGATNVTLTIRSAYQPITTESAADDGRVRGLYMPVPDLEITKREKARTKALQQRYRDEVWDEVHAIRSEQAAAAT